MPKSIVTILYRNGKPDCANLDSRYFGRKRDYLRIELAEDMARLDDIIEARGIKPGDRIEIQCHRDKKGYPLMWDSEVPGFEKWRPEYFVEVANGRFRTNFDPTSNQGGGSGTTHVIDVRKYPPES